MKPQFQHFLLPSFLLWLDWVLFNKGEAFKNYDNATFFETTDDRLPNKSIYAASHKGFVYDNGIPNANILSSVTIDGTPESDLIIDYKNGRVILPSGNTGLTMTGSYAAREFNVYPVNEGEEEFVLDKVIANKKYLDEPDAATSPYDYYAPCLIVSFYNMRNKPFAFGGMDNSMSYIRVTAISNNNFHIVGLNSLFVDQSKGCFPLVSSFSDLPLNEWNDLKDKEPYSYAGLINKYSGDKKVCLDNVFASDVAQQQNTSDSLGNLFMSIIQFELSTPRFPRI